MHKVFEKGPNSGGWKSAPGLQDTWTFRETGVHLAYRTPRRRPRGYDSKGGGRFRPLIPL